MISFMSTGKSFLINFGFIKFNKTGRIVKLPRELVIIIRAIKKPSSESMLNFESIKTAKPAPTDTALNKIAFPEPKKVSYKNWPLPFVFKKHL